MAIEISGAPVPAQSPRFAGVTLRVPLSEEPSGAWLDVLVAQAKLPGKGHRIEGSVLELHLSHGDRDVRKALRNLDAAVASANERYAADRELLEQEARGPATRAEAAARKIAPLCAEWWEGKSSARGSADPPELGPGAATE